MRCLTSVGSRTVPALLIGAQGAPGPSLILGIRNLGGIRPVRRTSLLRSGNELSVLLVNGTPARTCGKWPILRKAASLLSGRLKPLNSNPNLPRLFGALQRNPAGATRTT